MIGAAVLLYACNKLWFLPAASGPLRLFLAWYFSDLLAGALLLALVELLLVLGRLSPIRSVPAAAGYLLACGLFLELAPLLYKPSSVCDPWDLLAYLDRVDGCGMRFALSNVVESRGRRNDILADWVERHPGHYRMIPLDFSYSNSNYHIKDKGSATREVLVVNYS